MKVIRIKSSDAWPWCLEFHYAKTIPSISYAFALYDGGDILGVCTFGTPASAPLRRGICGIEFEYAVQELNRLALNTSYRNAASFLVSHSLRHLGNKIIVSYADTKQGHIGYVYQACNFLYTGLSAKRTNWTIRNKEHLHGQTIVDESRGITNRAEWMRSKYGDDFSLTDRSRKHRYVYFCGSRRFKRDALKALKYPIIEYPKGESSRYRVEQISACQFPLFKDHS